MLESEKAEGDQPKRDWSKTLDLDRKTLTSNFVGRAKEQLDALQRVSRACGLDLFDWADTSH